MVISSNLPIYLIPITLVFVVVALALNSIGGKFVKLVAYFISGLLSLFLLIVAAMGISLFYNNEYDSVSPIIFTALGFIGCISIYGLKNWKFHNSFRT